MRLESLDLQKYAQRPAIAKALCDYMQLGCMHSKEARERERERDRGTSRKCEIAANMLLHRDVLCYRGFGAIFESTHNFSLLHHTAEARLYYARNPRKALETCLRTYCSPLHGELG